MLQEILREITEKKRIKKLVNEKHYCPHCKAKLSLVYPPIFSFSDGLGWGEYLWLCLNDDCKMFTNSWSQLRKKYGRNAGVRFGFCPGEKVGGPIFISSPEDYKNSVVEKENFYSLFIKIKKILTRWTF
jgi:hypothetical protein